MNSSGTEAIWQRLGEARTSQGLQRRLASFSASLLDPLRPIPDGLISPGGAHSTRRFNVYRNNVVSGLIEVLREAFPATKRIVGEEFFSALARAFVFAHPPTSARLFEYGGDFPAFIESFEPAASLLYLADVALIEQRWVEAYHAPEACPVSATALSRLSPEDFASATIAFHPSVRLVRSAYPVLTIWQMNVGLRPMERVVTLGNAEDALICRPHALVDVHALPLGAATFLACLMEGEPVLKATESAIAAASCFDLAKILSLVLEAGAFAGVAPMNASPVSESSGPL